MEKEKNESVTIEEPSNMKVDSDIKYNSELVDSESMDSEDKVTLNSCIKETLKNVTDNGISMDKESNKESLADEELINDIQEGNNKLQTSRKTTCGNSKSTKSDTGGSKIGDAVKTTSTEDQKCLTSSSQSVNSSQNVPTGNSVISGSTSVVPSNTRSTRSQNPEFLARQRNFLHKVHLASSNILIDEDMYSDDDTMTTSKTNSKSSVSVDETVMDSTNTRRKRERSASSGTISPRIPSPSVANMISGSASNSGSSSPAVNQMQPATKRRRSTRTDSTGTQQSPAPGSESAVDRFCWLCHRDGTVINCETCSRAYHTRCVQLEVAPTEDWVCPECITILHAENTETRSRAMKMLSLDQFCNLLKYTVSRMKTCTGAEPFCKPVDLNEFSKYRDYVAHPMDLSLLERNIKKRMYGSTEAFLADTKRLLHNCIIFNTYQSGLTSIAKKLLKICKEELAEIEVCPDCYLYAHTRKDTWFIEVCRKPHILVWAKLKGFPFWPGKAMRTNREGLVDVRFFGAHDKAWVPIKDCFLYSKTIPASARKQKRNNLDACVEELEEHAKKLKDKFGEFHFAPFRTQFEPEKEKEQMKMLLPLYSMDGDEGAFNYRRTRGIIGGYCVRTYQRSHNSDKETQEKNVENSKIRTAENNGISIADSDNKNKSLKRRLSSVDGCDDNSDDEKRLPKRSSNSSRLSNHSSSSEEGQESDGEITQEKSNGIAEASLIEWSRFEESAAKLTEGLEVDEDKHSINSDDRKIKYSEELKDKYVKISQRENEEKTGHNMAELNSVVVASQISKKGPGLAIVDKLKKRLRKSSEEIKDIEETYIEASYEETLSEEDKKTEDCDNHISANGAKGSNLNSVVDDNSNSNSSSDSDESDSYSSDDNETNENETDREKSASPIVNRISRAVVPKCYGKQYYPKVVLHDLALPLYKSKIHGEGMKHDNKDIENESTGKKVKSSLTVEKIKDNSSNKLTETLISGLDNLHEDRLEKSDHFTVNECDDLEITTNKDTNINNDLYDNNISEELCTVEKATSKSIDKKNELCDMSSDSGDGDIEMDTSKRTPEHGYSRINTEESISDILQSGESNEQINKSNKDDDGSVDDENSSTSVLEPKEQENIFDTVSIIKSQLLNNGITINLLPSNSNKISTSENEKTSNNDIKLEVNYKLKEKHYDTSIYEKADNAESTRSVVTPTEELHLVTETDHETDQNISISNDDEEPNIIKYGEEHSNDEITHTVETCNKNICITEKDHLNTRDQSVKIKDETDKEGTISVCSNDGELPYHNVCNEENCHNIGKECDETEECSTSIDDLSNENVQTKVEPIESEDSNMDSNMFTEEAVIKAHTTEQNLSQDETNDKKNEETVEESNKRNTDDEGGCDNMAINTDVQHKDKTGNLCNNTQGSILNKEKDESNSTQKSEAFSILNKEKDGSNSIDNENTEKTICENKSKDSEEESGKINVLEKEREKIIEHFEKERENNYGTKEKEVININVNSEKENDNLNVLPDKKNEIESIISGKESLSSEKESLTPEKESLTLDKESLISEKETLTSEKDPLTSEKGNSSLRKESNMDDNSIEKENKQTNERKGSKNNVSEREKETCNTTTTPKLNVTCKMVGRIKEEPLDEEELASSQVNSAVEGPIAIIPSKLAKPNNHTSGKHKKNEEELMFDANYKEVQINKKVNVSKFDDKDRLSSNDSPASLSERDGIFPAYFLDPSISITVVGENDNETSDASNADKIKFGGNNINMNELRASVNLSKDISLTVVGAGYNSSTKDSSTPLDMECDHESDHEDSNNSLKTITPTSSISSSVNIQNKQKKLKPSSNCESLEVRSKARKSFSNKANISGVKVKSNAELINGIGTPNINKTPARRNSNSSDMRRNSYIPSPHEISPHHPNGIKPSGENVGGESSNNNPSNPMMVLPPMLGNSPNPPTNHIQALRTVNGSIGAPSSLVNGGNDLITSRMMQITHPPGSGARISPASQGTSSSGNSRMPPQLQPRPPGPLLSLHPPVLPSEAGSLATELNRHSHKLAEFMRAIVEDMLRDLSSLGNPEATVKSLQLELEKLKWRHNQELSEMKHNTDLVVMEVRNNMENERQRAVAETIRQCELEKQRAVDETKKKQWCTSCGKEALFYCCWNTSYCDYPCQQRHWPQHMNSCAQNSAQNETGGHDGNEVVHRSSPQTSSSSSGHKISTPQQQQPWLESIPLNSPATTSGDNPTLLPYHGFFNKKGTMNTLDDDDDDDCDNNNNNETSQQRDSGQEIQKETISLEELSLMNVDGPKVVKKRKRCGKCTGCTTVGNCGQCPPCNSVRTHQVCRQRRCTNLLMESTTSVANPSSKRSRINPQQKLQHMVSNGPSGTKALGPPPNYSSPVMAQPPRSMGPGMSRVSAQYGSMVSRPSSLQISGFTQPSATPSTSLMPTTTGNFDFLPLRVSTSFADSVNSDGGGVEQHTNNLIKSPKPLICSTLSEISDEVAQNNFTQISLGQNTSNNIIHKGNIVSNVATLQESNMNVSNNNSAVPMFPSAQNHIVNVPRTSVGMLYPISINYVNRQLQSNTNNITIQPPLKIFNSSVGVSNNITRPEEQEIQMSCPIILSRSIEPNVLYQSQL